MPFGTLVPELLAVVINLRLTPKEKDRLRVDSDFVGLTMSELVSGAIRCWRRGALVESILRSVSQGNQTK